MSSKAQRAKFLKEKLDAFAKEGVQFARFADFLQSSYGFELLAFHRELKEREACVRVLRPTRANLVLSSVRQCTR